jgi:23S rRNA (adenine2030-N6)-methyltransferase
MNYRHAFHAGNFADVLKHATLALILERLAAKPAPFLYLDTHAGRARYDLDGDEATRTGEARDGIGRLLAEAHPAPALKPYLDIVRALNAPGDPALRYPGSPWIARKMTRPQDRLLLCELHPEDAIELRRANAGDRRVEVRRADGWVALKSDLPPPERRGLVLIDPPFEAKDEYARLARGLRHAHRRFATGVLVAWYPIKTRAPVEAFQAEMVAAGLRRLLVAELLVRAPAPPETESPRLAGCGLLIVNPPWTLTGSLAGLMPTLARLLGQGPGAAWRLETLVGE